MPLDTQRVSQAIRRCKFPNSLSNFLQLAFSFDLAAASESLWMHSSAEVFICAKLKHLAWKTFLSSVRWGANVDKRKAPCWIFLFSEVALKQRTLHNFNFWQLLQCGSNTQNLTPSSHCCLARQLPCFACALQPPTFCLHCNLMHRQASRSQRWNSKTLP